jgi:hypothetical protein
MLVKIIRWLLAGGVLLGAWLMLLLTLPYTAMDRHTDFLMTKQLVYHIRTWRVSFYVHVFISIVVLLTGLIQCSWYLLRKYPRLHRRSGNIYVAVVLLFSGPSGLIMAFYANGGLPARISFVILALLWLFTTFMGWWYAKKGRWAAHGAMLIRSYALTLSALTLRSYALLIDVFNLHIRPVHAYILISWLSWTINLLVAEAIIYWGFKRVRNTFQEKKPQTAL